MEKKNQILGKPMYGWSSLLFQTSDNWDKPIPLSYLDDVPIILYGALIDAMEAIKRGANEMEVPFSVVFDGEGRFYSINNILGRLCVSWDGSEDGTRVISYLLFPSNIYIEDAVPTMAKMVAADIRENIDAWVEWDSSLPLREEDPEAFTRKYAERKELLLTMCGHLERLADEIIKR